MVHPDTEAAVDDVEIVDGAEQETIDSAPQGDAGMAELYPDDTPEVEDTPEGEDEQDDDDAEQDEEDEDDLPLEAPASLNAEEREKFKALPEEARDFLSSAIKRREEAAQQGVAKALETQETVTRQAADRVAQTQQVYARQFAGLVEAFAPKAPPVELARTNPAEYQFQKAMYDEQLGDFQQLVGQIQGIDQEAEQHFEQQKQAWIQGRAKQLMADPDYAAAEDKTAYFDPIIGFGVKELGYDFDGLVKDAEAQDIINIKRAMRWKEKADRWDNHMKKRNERPRKATGRFSRTAPTGARVASQQAPDPLKALYPND